MPVMRQGQPAFECRYLRLGVCLGRQFVAARILQGFGGGLGIEGGCHAPKANAVSGRFEPKRRPPFDTRPLARVLLRVRERVRARLRALPHPE